MDKYFLIKVESIEVRDEIGNLLHVFQKPSGLMEDDFGKYILDDRNNEKVYFEYRPVGKVNGN